MPYNSRLLFHQLSRGEDGEVRNPPNGISSRKLLVDIRVNLQNDCLTRHLFRSARDLRCCCPAGTAPVRPEVHKHRNARTLDDFVEQRGIHLQGLVQREAAASCTRRIDPCPLGGLHRHGFSDHNSCRLLSQAFASLLFIGYIRQAMVVLWRSISPLNSSKATSRARSTSNSRPPHHFDAAT